VTSDESRVRQTKNDQQLAASDMQQATFRNYATNELQKPSEIQVRALPMEWRFVLHGYIRVDIE